MLRGSVISLNEGDKRDSDSDMFVNPGMNNSNSWRLFRNFACVVLFLPKSSFTRQVRVSKSRLVSFAVMLQIVTPVKLMDCFYKNINEFCLSVTERDAVGRQITSGGRQRGPPLYSTSSRQRKSSRRLF